MILIENRAKAVRHSSPGYAPIPAVEIEAFTDHTAKLPCAPNSSEYACDKLNDRKRKPCACESRGLFCASSSTRVPH